MNTIILVTSSFTMHWALQSIKRGNRAGLQAGLALTFLLGLTFLLTQILEYSRIGFAPHDGAFATVFFGLTGLHGAHVFVGLTLLLGRDGPLVPRPLLARAPPRRRDPRHLLALRRRDVDRRLHDGLHHLAVSRTAAREEAEAFQFLLGAAVYFGLIAIAGGDRRVGRARASSSSLSVIVVLWWVRSRRRRGARRQEAPRSRSGPDELRILVVANETVGGGELRDRITERAHGQRAEVLVVTPALNTPLKHCTSDIDGAREEAGKRLEDSLARLRGPGSRRAARSATATRSRRSRTRCARSARTR